MRGYTATLFRWSRRDDSGLEQPKKFFLLNADQKIVGKKNQRRNARCKEVYSVIGEKYRAVADHHPRKQGLKQGSPPARAYQHRCRRPSSTKTRIETTVGGMVIPPVLPRRRPSSTKTRIETYTGPLCQHMADRVADHHPRKQGLKLNNGSANTTAANKSQTIIQENKD